MTGDDWRLAKSKSASQQVLRPHIWTERLAPQSPTTASSCSMLHPHSGCALRPWTCFDGSTLRAVRRIYGMEFVCAQAASQKSLKFQLLLLLSCCTFVAHQIHCDPLFDLSLRDQVSSCETCELLVCFTLL